MRLEQLDLKALDLRVRQVRRALQAQQDLRVRQVLQAQQDLRVRRALQAQQDLRVRQVLLVPQDPKALDPKGLRELPALRVRLDRKDPKDQHLTSHRLAEV